jgi:hypothetical protein
MTDDLSREDRDACRAIVRRVETGGFGGWDIMAEERRTALKDMFAVAPAKASKKPKPPTLERALKAADKAGRQVRGAAIYSDRVEITFGQPEAAGEEITTPDQLRRLL